MLSGAQFIHLPRTLSMLARRKNDPRYICGTNGCNKHHHSSLHGSTTPFVASVNAVRTGDGESHLPPNAPVLLSMQSIPSSSGNINSFFDDGSDCTLILNSAAQRLGLRGEDIMMEVETVIGVVKTPSQVYTVTIFDQKTNHMR